MILHLWSSSSYKILHWSSGYLLISVLFTSVFCSLALLAIRSASLLSFLPSNRRCIYEKGSFSTLQPVIILVKSSPYCCWVLINCTTSKQSETIWHWSQPCFFASMNPIMIANTSAAKEYFIILFCCAPITQIPFPSLTIVTTLASHDSLSHEASTLI